MPGCAFAANMEVADSKAKAKLSIVLFIDFFLFIQVVLFEAFALTGRQTCVHDYPGRCPGLGASALSGRVELTCET